MRDIEDLVENRVFNKYLRKSLPLDNYIYLKLLESPTLDLNTLKSMIREAGYQVSDSRIMRTLMRMEIRGVLYVEGNAVHLVREKRYLVVDEDRASTSFFSSAAITSLGILSIFSPVLAEVSK